MLGNCYPGPSPRPQTHQCPNSQMEVLLLLSCAHSRPGHSHLFQALSQSLTWPSALVPPVLSQHDSWKDVPTPIPGHVPPTAEDNSWPMTCSTCHHLPQRSHQEGLTSLFLFLTDKGGNTNAPATSPNEDRVERVFVPVCPSPMAVSSFPLENSL